MSETTLPTAPANLAAEIARSPLAKAVHAFVQSQGKLSDLLAAQVSKTAPETLRSYFFALYVASKLYGAVSADACAKALGALGALNSKSTATEGRKRTADEQQVCDAARVAWHRFAKRWEVKTAETRGGARERNVATTSKADKVKAERVETAKAAAEVLGATGDTFAHPRDGAKYLEQVATTLRAMIRKYPAAFLPAAEAIAEAFADGVDTYVGEVKAAE